MTFYIRQGDLTPVLQEALRDENGQPYDLTGATVQLQWGLPGTGISQTRSAQIVGTTTQGVVKYAWAAGDTDLHGVFGYAWVVTKTGDRRTFPLTGGNQLVIVPSQAASATGQGFELVAADTQTFWLLRRLRDRLGDSKRLLYPDDNQLVQALRDQRSAYSGQAGVTLTPAGTARDPLATTEALTDDQREVWMLVTARAVLHVEVLEAARVAATIRTPAGAQNLQDVHVALRRALTDVETELEERLDSGVGLIAFADLLQWEPIQSRVPIPGLGRTA